MKKTITLKRFLEHIIGEGIEEFHSVHQIDRPTVINIIPENKSTWITITLTINLKQENTNTDYIKELKNKGII